MRAYAKSYKRKIQKRVVAAVCLLILVLCCSFILSGVLRSGKSEAQDPKPVTYHSVMIETGDSLWSIASENLPAGYESVNEFMQEIIRVNDLGSTQIEAGNYLLVPTYAD